MYVLDYVYFDPSNVSKYKVKSIHLENKDLSLTVKRNVSTEAIIEFIHFSLLFSYDIRLLSQFLTNFIYNETHF